MVDCKPAYDTILSQFVDWARERADIRAVMMVGSRARSDHPADQWADLDIISFTNTPGRYFNETDWIDRFGEVWAKTRNQTAGGEPEWLVCYAGGLDVDFVFNANRQAAGQFRVLNLLERFPVIRRALPRTAQIRIDQGRAMGAATLARGYRILLDKDGLLERMASLLGDPPSYHPPAPEEFAGRVARYWLLVERISKKIGRGELAVALSWMNGLYWSALLPMIEWHAHAARDAQTDTWHAGRFLEEWADPRVVAALPCVFPAYDLVGARAALLASMALFHWLGEETASRLGYTYPAEVDQAVSEYIHSILDPGFALTTGAAGEPNENLSRLMR